MAKDQSPNKRVSSDQLQSKGWQITKVQRKWWQIIKSPRLILSRLSYCLALLQPADPASPVTTPAILDGEPASCYRGRLFPCCRSPPVSKERTPATTVKRGSAEGRASEIHTGKLVSCRLGFLFGLKINELWCGSSQIRESGMNPDLDRIRSSFHCIRY